MSITVLLPSGKSLALQDGATALDAAKALSQKLAETTVVARVNGQVQDVRLALPDGATLELLTPESPEGRDTVNHSAEHILAMAVLKLIPGAKVTMGPKTHAEEFYYDFDIGSRTLTPDDLGKIEEEMRKIVASKARFERKSVTKAEARELFEAVGQNNEYKTEILARIPEDVVSLYQSGDFVDLCRGPHLPHAGFIKGLKLTAASSAYWGADSSKQSLQRVRGVAFSEKGKLEEYLHRIEEAKRRDHRKLGKELELFLVSERYESHSYSEDEELDLYVGVQADAPLDRELIDFVLSAAQAACAGRSLRQTVNFAPAPAREAVGVARATLDVRFRGALPVAAKTAFEAALKQRSDVQLALVFEPNYIEELGPGLVMWLPKGGLLRTIIEDLWRKMHLESGYDVVYSPHIAKSDLWKVSGHWNFYREGMFSPMSVDGHDYCCKPMNCPFHILMVKSRMRSYREFPMRLAELGTVYRYELAGVMHGLMRVRGFTQDDAHLFCRSDQVELEIERVLRFIFKMLRTFGFEEFEINLSTRPEKYVGSVEAWERAEQVLGSVLQRLGRAYEIDPGGGAFYGPKIDIKLVDALDRKWQCSTLQYDFNNPERFSLEFVNAAGEREQPIMLHRALLGSVERFIGILIEHHAGALPAWLSPEQARILTVSDRHNAHAERLVDELRAAGLRAHFEPSADKLGAKIRAAQLGKVPFMLVVGDKEVESNGATLRLRDGSDMGFMTTEALIAELRERSRTPSVTA